VGGEKKSVIVEKSSDTESVHSFVRDFKPGKGWGQKEKHPMDFRLKNGKAGWLGEKGLEKLACRGLWPCRGEGDKKPTEARGMNHMHLHALKVPRRVISN